MMSNIKLELYNNKYLYSYVSTHFNPKKKFFTDSPIYIYDRYMNKYRIRCSENCGTEDTLNVNELDNLIKNHKNKKVVTNNGFVFIESNNNITWKCVDCNKIKSKFVIQNTNNNTNDNIKTISEYDIKINKINNYSNGDNIKNLLYNTIKNISCEYIKEYIVNICDIFIEIDKLFDKIEKLHNEHYAIINENINIKKEKIHIKNTNKKKKILLLSANKLKYNLIDNYNNICLCNNYNNYANILIDFIKIYNKYINYFKYI